mmetsp:Transcript_34102/g.87210  ORF Transcript_34102/g.87210 Transcript_34102/m.87210 type:complete len:342 (+) Transcript_34102:708-1733(+)
MEQDGRPGGRGGLTAHLALGPRSPRDGRRTQVHERQDGRALCRGGGHRLLRHLQPRHLRRRHRALLPPAQGRRGLCVCGPSLLPPLRRPLRRRHGHLRRQPVPLLPTLARRLRGAAQPQRRRVPQRLPARLPLRRQVRVCRQRLARGHGVLLPGGALPPVWRVQGRAHHPRHPQPHAPGLRARHHLRRAWHAQRLVRRAGVGVPGAHARPRAGQGRGGQHHEGRHGDRRPHHDGQPGLRLGDHHPGRRLSAGHSAAHPPAPSQRRGQRYRHGGVGPQHRRAHPCQLQPGRHVRQAHLQGQAAGGAGAAGEPRHPARRLHRPPRLAEGARHLPRRGVGPAPA